MENLDILWVVFTLHKFSHLWQMIYSVFVVRFSYIPLKRKRIGLAGSFWRERDCSYPGSIRAYLRGSSPVSEKEGWRDRAGGKCCRQKFREILRNCRELTGMGSQPELLENSTCPAEAEGIMQNLVQIRKPLSCWNGMKPGSKASAGKASFINLLLFLFCLA